MRTAAMIVLAAGLAAAGPAARPAAAAPDARLGGQVRYWSFNDGRDLRDALAYWSAPWFHAQLEYWDFVDPAAEDRWRPELGLHLRDRRRGVYRVQWRHERAQERFWLGTDQVLGRHLVVRGEASPIVTRDSTLWVGALGMDGYWGSWNYASLDVVRDPRLDGLWIVPMRVRIANEANDWVQVTWAPASRRTVGWAFDVKKRWFRAGIERNSRFDFTAVDNTIVTVGFELELRPVD